MLTPTPPSDHTCWRVKVPEWVQHQESPLKHRAGFGWRLKDVSALPPEGEATCPACQWLAGYEAGRGWVGAWLEGIADECNRDSRLAAPVAATAASTLAHELRKVVQEPPHA